jgi:hypothetical protein
MGALANVKNTLPAELQGVFNADDLAGDLYDGIQGGFAVISIRGSRFRIAKGGEEEVMLNEKEEPIGSLECVIVKASRNVSKIFYKAAYAEGDAESPDCWSVNGLTPDAGAELPQSKTCATCPQNVWGSKITPAGKKTKACGDNRRTAVVPLGDILNKKYDGAMMLRIPAASLADLALYGKGMAGKGFPYNAIATRIGFDTSASFPKLTFKPIRALTEEELGQVAEIAVSPTVHTILDAPVDAAPAAAEAPEPEAAVSLDFEAEVATAEATIAPSAGADIAAAAAQVEVDKKAAAAVKRKANAKAKKLAAAKAALAELEGDDDEAEPEVATTAVEPVVADAAAEPAEDAAEESLDDLLADLDSLG